jgi:ABC-type branched-subunit amino acid transport system substrate-binding protein
VAGGEVTRSIPRFVVALALALFGCADIVDINTSRYLVSAGACEGTLRARVIADLSGPTKDVGVAAGKGVFDHLRAIEARGGIKGCRVEAQLADMKYDVETTLSTYRAWSSAPEWNEVVTVFGQGTPMTQALAPLAAGEKKVVITTAWPGELAAPQPIEHDVGVPSLSGSFAEATVPVRKRSPGYPFVFFAGTDYTTAARIAMSFVWRRGAKRVGFAACTTSAFCTDPVDGAKTFLPVLGTTKVGRDLAIELTDDDATVTAKVEAYLQAELDRKTADPTYEPIDWLWFGNTRVTAARLGRALAAAKTKLGFAPSVITNHWSLDELLASECGGSACDGFFGVEPLPVFDDRSASGMADLVTVHRDFRRADGEPESALATVQYVSGYVAVAMWKQAVEAIIDSGKKVDGETLRTTLETFAQRNIDGLATVSFTATDHRPQSASRIYTLAPGGKIEPVGQPLSVALQREWLGW